MLSDPLVQPADAGQPLRHPLPGQRGAGLVLDQRVVMFLSPVDSNEDHLWAAALDYRVV